MDPLTIALAAVALLGTEATKKVGGKLGEGTLAAAQRLLELLRQKAPATAKQLEAADSPEVIEAEIIEDVRRVADQDPEVQAAVEATAEMMQQQFGSVINQGKLAEKIGFLIQGGHNPITIDKVEL